MFLVAPSNATIVRYWLARLPPFNAIPPGAEVFHGFQTVFIEQTLARTNCELVPVFFCQPDVFENLVDLVALGRGLPKWAASPLEFVYLPRKALESDHVSAHLHEWIDLLFGVAAEGARARECWNAHDPMLAADVW